jgi:molybdate transport system ATP-binding protein
MLNIAIESVLQSFTLSCRQQLTDQGITGILGHSGSGKTSLLRLIAGLDLGARGHIVFNGKTIFNSTTQTFIPAEQRDIGFVFQDGRLFPHLSVRKNLEFAAKRTHKRQLDVDTVSELTGISHLLARSIDKLSAGEKQRVALARALVGQPQLLLLDEPLAHLDTHSRHQMIILLKQIQQQLSLPMLYISHNIMEIQQLANQVWVLADGQIIQTGNVHQVLNNLKGNSQSSYQLQTSLELELKRHHCQHGLSELQLPPNIDNSNAAEHVSLFMPLLDAPERSRVRCFIRASDISVCLTKPNDSSIVNELSGVIESITTDKASVFLKVNCHGQLFNAHISKYSYEKLALYRNQQVFIQFKAGALATL